MIRITREDEDEVETIETEIGVGAILAFWLTLFLIAALVKWVLA